MNKGIEASCLTDIGKKREFNEDCICEVKDACFFAVADGMGQMLRAKETAETICHMMEVNAPQIYEEWQETKDEEAAAELLKDVVERISNSIYKKGNSPEVYRYGCTFCGVMIFDRYAAFVNIGDSRAYITEKESGLFRQVTEDENLAAFAVKSGYLTYDEAKKRGFASRLENFIGISEETKVQLTLVERASIKNILLCTDGLCGMAEDAEIQKVLAAYDDSEEACRALVDLANQNGGKDNISVSCIFLNAED